MKTKIALLLPAIMITAGVFVSCGGGGGGGGGGGSLPSLVSISITPPEPGLSVGTDQQFTATGLYSNNTSSVLTNLVTWQSSSTGVAAFQNPGLARALSPGSTTISALMSGVTGSTVLTVTAFSPGTGLWDSSNWDACTWGM